MNTDKNPQNKQIPQEKTIATAEPENTTHAEASQGLNVVQQHFVLKFCRQLASVIQACDQSESAEIEVGRRHIGEHQVRVKLQARRKHSQV